ncbi:MAG: energy-coupling factor ABC transporter ATP-binding protein, partial [Treponema sp.]|nr:energy-coupling factor ABC transporter ATP-binding protein [Treponema sp.]
MPLFSIRNLVKKFPGGLPGEEFPALDGVSLDIEEGRCMVIAGSNGSGKTVLMKIVAALLEPDSGEVIFRGEPLFGGRAGSRMRETERRLRGELGLVFQDADAQIVGETVAEDAAFGPENLGFSPEQVRSRVDAALSSMGLGRMRERSPRRLSGGEKRRLAVAGVLASGCRTVIMDEPFANLD